ncbi:MAG: CIA30 family protein [Treponema sp.]|nr:CIA30 family protein [Treponema sp.]MCL2252094.1 CIA30 family protein [Treponema sp.]
MKKTNKLMSAILCLVLIAVVLSCATTGGKKLPPVLATGEWMTYNDRDSDGGSSISNLEVKEDEIDGKLVTVYHITGNVTTQFEYGFAGWGIDADNATMELYKNAEALSFYILGDGKRYSIKFKISSVEDYCYHEYTFTTTEGVAEYFEVPMAFFMQPSWGSPVKFDPSLVTGIEWQTHESWRTDPRNNPFEVKMWNFMIHPGAPKKVVKAEEKLVPGVLGSFDLLLRDNFQYGDGYQGEIRAANMLNGHKLTVGDSFTVKFSYSASRDLEQDVEFGFVDITPAANYWRALSWKDGSTDIPMPSLPASKAGEVVSGEFVFTIVNNATSASAVANVFVFTTKGQGRKGTANSGALKAVTLSFKEFTVTKN